ncbi:MAG: response regulator [Myxococcaceae bacterium]
MIVKRKILVVDDSATARAQLTITLGPGYDCLEAVNGREGFEMALANLPDAVLADIEMPELDGLGLLQALRDDARTSGIPTIVITSVTAVGKVNQARALGCAGFVLKPVGAEYLLAKLSKLFA